MTRTFDGPFMRGLASTVCAVALFAGMVNSIPASAQEVEPPEIASFAAASEPPQFDTPEAAVAAFAAALEEAGNGSVAALLGLDAERLSADANSAETLAAIREGAAKQLVLEGAGDRRILEIGEKLWPLPFPIVRGDDDKWAFDTFAGLEEIINRYVGENELTAIETMRAYVDAQEDYASQDRDGDGVMEYAQRLVSTEGKTDGLYWPNDEVNGPSPAGDLVQSELDDASKGEGYFGYKFKILTGQGDHIAGGAYDYVINGNMIAGFGLIAWPAKYGESGVNTFAVNQQGVVYEVHLGPATDTVVKYIDRFNPDETWEIVAD